MDKKALGTHAISYGSSVSRSFQLPEITPLDPQSIIFFLFLEENAFLSMQVINGQQWSVPGLWQLQSFESLGKAFLHPSEDLICSALWPGGCVLAERQCAAQKVPGFQLPVYHLQMKIT